MGTRRWGLLGAVTSRTVIPHYGVLLVGGCKPYNVRGGTWVGLRPRIRCGFVVVFYTNTLLFEHTFRYVGCLCGMFESTTCWVGHPLVWFIGGITTPYQYHGTTQHSLVVVDYRVFVVVPG